MAIETPWHIFFKCFQNKATQEEIEEINSWLGEDTENVKIIEEVYNVYAITDVIPALLTPDTEKAWQKVNQKTSSKNNSVRPLYFKFRKSIAIAAAIIFGLLLVGIINNLISKKQYSCLFTEIVTQPGQKTSVILPDGSTVWLNSASTLKYSADFNRNDREVTLTGEAFFKVKKNKSKNFRVISGALNVDVHGTSFDVKNYSDENTQRVTVEEGVVSLINNSKETRNLTKGDHAILDKETGEISFTKVNPGEVTAWKNNELIFRNTPIEDVIKSLEGWYGVNITVDNKMIKEHNYTFKVKAESFREVLEMIKIMTPIEYEINGKDITIRYKN